MEGGYYSQQPREICVQFLSIINNSKLEASRCNVTHTGRFVVCFSCLHPIFYLSFGYIK